MKEIMNGNGSEKQIKWANELREKAFGKIYNTMVAVRSAKTPEEIRGWLDGAFERLPGDARFWIDNRTSWDNAQTAMQLIAPYIR